MPRSYVHAIYHAPFSRAAALARDVRHRPLGFALLSVKPRWRRGKACRASGFTAANPVPMPTDLLAWHTLGILPR